MCSFVTGVQTCARPIFSRSRGRSRSMFFRLWVRAPRMRMVSIAIGGGDLGSGGGGRRRDRDRTEERNEPPIWGQMVEIASLPERRRSGRDAARSGRSEERRVGKECVRSCGYGGSRYHKKKKN